MKKRLSIINLLILISLFFASCEKVIYNEEVKKSDCNYENDSTFLNKKWVNTFTKIDIVDNKDSVIYSETIHPVGYFQLNLNKSYNVLSNDVPLNGKWNIDANCLLVLDANTSLERKFNIIKANQDSLIIQRKDGQTIYTQYYTKESGVPCLCIDRGNELTKKWKNTVTTIDEFNSLGNVINSYNIYPIGYFQLFKNNKYEVFSDGNSLNGKWEINIKNCNLILDKGSDLERCFIVKKLTSDSLVIYRRDDNIAYTQKYNR